MDTKNKILSAWRNLGTNLTQKRRYKKEIADKAEKEAEQIFMKTNPKMADKDGNFPKVGPNTPRKYRREVKRIDKQVKKTRMQQAKDKGII